MNSKYQPPPPPIQTLIDWLIRRITQVLKSGINLTFTVDMVTKMAG